MKAAIVILGDDGFVYTVAIAPTQLSIENEIVEVDEPGSSFRALRHTGKKTITLSGDVLAYRDATPQEATLINIRDVPALPAPKDA